MENGNRKDKDYVVVCLDGPNHGMVMTGEEAFGFLFLAGYMANGEKAIGRKVRTLPWYAQRALHLFGRDTLAVLRGVGVDVGPGLVYKLESTGDPVIFRYVGEYDEARDG